MHWKAVYGTFSRRKPLVDCAESKLAKVLSTFDLTALGIGSTLGVGVYVLAGGVSKTTAGPAVVISFLIAAIASVFAGLCYAEFGARVPKAGSAYVYSYVTIGEFVAFVIGWNLILEYAIGSASVAKAISTYIDSLMGNTIANYSINYMPMDVEGLGRYPDFLSFAITALFTLAVAFGAKESTIVNNVFTLVNLTVVVFVVIAGLFKVDTNNWKIPSSQVPEGYGSGGFTPYGISGIIKGAATCFYGFIGFDCIATAGEEAKNPKKSIPISICVSLAMIFLAYFSVSTVLTMMVPYYEQNENAPLPHVFREYGWTAAVYIVSGGALCALLSSLMGAIFPLPRIVFAMASDGLIFRFLGEISPRFKTPFVGTLITGSITGVLSAIFDLTQLINMMSIGTLLAYTMVASCVLILRYCRDDRNKKFIEIPFKKRFEIRRLLNVESLKSPTEETETTAMCSVTLYCFFCFGLGSVICFMADELEQAKPHSILLLIVFAILSILSLIIVYRQPKSSAKLAFKVPFVPWLPGISILINVYLMLKLDYHTWVRFGAWIILGILIYFAYGIRNSNERTKDKSAENGAPRALTIDQTNNNDTMSTHF